MLLYQILDRAFPRSYLAKVVFVTVVFGQLPLLAMLALRTDGAAGWAHGGAPLVICVVASALGLTAALRAVLRPIDRLEATFRTYEAGQTRPVALPQGHADAVGRLMTRANTLMRTTETRIDAERRLADRDPLTCLLNRRGFERALQVSDGTAVGGSVLMLDLDHFKAVNDAHGHDVGDRMLRDLAGLLRGQLRRQDIAARFGGEEFVIYLHGVGRARALQVAERLRMSIEDRLSAGAAAQTASVGVATWESGEPIAAVLKRADEAVYAAKAAGRNRVHVSANPFGLCRTAGITANAKTTPSGTASGRLGAA